jgi:hypothetical protein
MRQLIALSLAAALAAGLGSAAKADVFVLGNDNSGANGSVAPITGGFELLSDTTGNYWNTTSYLAVAGAAETVRLDWSYTTTDPGGPSWEPAGYVANSVYTQLTNDNGAQSQSGALTFGVGAGQSYGFFIDSVFSTYPADIAVTTLQTTVAGVPEPSTWALLLLGFAAMAAAPRATRRRCWG